MSFLKTLPSALLLAISLFFVLPASLYVGGAYEIDLAFLTFLPTSFAVTLVATVVFAAIAFVARPVWDLRYVYFALSVALLIKSLFLPSNAPVLDGEAEFFPLLSQSGVLSVLTLLAALGAGGAMAYRYGIRFNGFALFLCVLLGMQPLLSSQNWAHKSQRQKQDTSKFFEFAPPPQQNTLVVLIDAFQSDAFAEVLDGSEARKRELDGFTYFHNTVGHFPFTKTALISIYSGEAYDPAHTIKSHYLKLQSNSIFGDFRTAGRDTYLVGQRYYNLCPALICSWRWDLIERVPHQENLKLYAELLNNALLRITPTTTHAWLYNGGEGRLAPLVPVAPVGGAIGSVQAVRELTARLSTTATASTFKFFHVMITHSPLTVSASCRQVGERSLTRANYIAQATCALDTFIELTKAMKAKNIYDNTTIVLMADHGASIRGQPSDSVFLDVVRAHSGVTGGRFNPLFAVKPRMSRDPLKLSSAPLQLSDLRATLCAIDIDCAPGVPGLDAFSVAEDADRERFFIGYDSKANRHTNEQDMLPADGFVRYTIGGSPDDLRRAFTSKAKPPKK